MSEDFRVGCWAKVERAEEHIENLKIETEAFFAADPKPYRIVREPEEEGVGYVWKGFEDRAPPPIIPILAGEAIHQLRSALDHLVTGMVRARGNSITTDHGFPITKERYVFEEARKRGQIKGISLAAQNLIESVQPYNAPDGYASSILWTLHRQDIEDKHRLLLVVNAAAFMHKMQVTAGVRVVDLGLQPPRRLTKEGVELFRLTIRDGDADFDPNPEFPPFIAFEEFGTVQLNPVFKALGEARDFVVQTINRFAGEFPAGHGVSGPIRDRSNLRPRPRPDSALQQNAIPASRG